MDGFAGMPGLHLLPLARAGCRVTVVHPDRRALARVELIYADRGLTERLELVESDRVPEGRQFELVFSFNALPLVDRWRGYLAALAVAATRHLAVFSTHRHTYGAWLRRGLRWAETERRDELFDHESTDVGQLRPELQQHGRVVAEAWADAPWWPDLFVDAGQSLLGASLQRLRLSRAPATNPAYDYLPETFPWVRDGLPSELRRALRRHPGFDARLYRLAPIFAHHRGFLLQRL